MTVRRRIVLGVLLAGFVLSAGSFLLGLLLLDVYWIPGVHMSPTIDPGDRVVARTFGGVSRGDIVVFRVPPDRPTEPAVRISRVVALGGDRVEATGGRLVVNGEPQDETYLPDGTTTQDFDPVVVPDDSMFILGDNRANAYDSRVRYP